jgi:hypothetical protein
MSAAIAAEVEMIGGPRKSYSDVIIRVAWG